MTTTLAQVIRTAVLIFGATAVLGALVALFAGGLAFLPLGLGALVIGAVCILAALLERERYDVREAPVAREGGLRPTDEVFVDPTTGERMRVWFDASSGARRYEREDAPR